MTTDAQQFDPSRFVQTFTLMAKAADLVRIERYDLAEPLVREILTLQPNSAPAHALLGHICYQLKRWDEARSEMETCLSLDPENTSALRQLGFLERDAGRNREAERYYLEALRIDPQDPMSLIAYSDLMFRTHHLEKAENLAHAALAVDPQNEAFHALLSHVQGARLHSKQAVITAHRSIALKPDAEVSHSALGMAYFRHGRPFIARRHLREAVRIDPSDAATVDTYHGIDKACRWTYLPMYYVSLALNRIPGEMYTVWGVLVAANLLVADHPTGSRVMTCIFLAWIAFCLYSFIASPLTRAWIKLFPPR
jgi:Flp pilus assembly protein TadD